MHARTRGLVTLPITIRIPVGGGIGSAEHHSESPEAYFAHTAGLRVVSVSEPAGRLHDAAPVDRERRPGRLLRAQAPVSREGPRWTTPSISRPRNRWARRASSAPAPTCRWSRSAVWSRTALDAATAAEDEGVSIEVIDLRSLSPIDYDTVAASVRHTGRVVIAQEGPREAGLASEIAAVVTERCFHFLEASPVRVTGHDIPYPPAKLEKHHLPDLDRMLHGVDRALGRVSSGVSA